AYGQQMKIALSSPNPAALDRSQGIINAISRTNQALRKVLTSHARHGPPASIAPARSQGIGADRDPGADKKPKHPPPPGRVDRRRLLSFARGRAARRREAGRGCVE